jgi:hypothetical protein
MIKKYKNVGSEFLKELGNDPSVKILIKDASTLPTSITNIVTHTSKVTIPLGDYFGNNP